MLIRPRTSADLDVLAEIAADVHATDGYPVYLSDNDFLGFLTHPPSSAAWVAEDDDRIVGHIAINTETNQSVMQLLRESGVEGAIGVIARLLVHPSARRQKVGTQLLDLARDEAAQRGWVPVLDVVAWHSPAVSLYRKAGWEEVGRVTFAVADQSITELVFAGPSD